VECIIIDDDDDEAPAVKSPTSASNGIHSPPKSSVKPPSSSATQRIPQSALDLYIHTLRSYGRVELYLEDWAIASKVIREDPDYVAMHEAVKRAAKWCETEEGKEEVKRVIVSGRGMG
jgi:hypothetical protein